MQNAGGNNEDVKGKMRKQGKRALNASSPPTETFYVGEKLI